VETEHQLADDSLSRTQFDGLLASGERSTEGETPAKERARSIRAYDFRHPSKLSKEQLRTMQMVFESFARNVGTGISATLRAQVNLAVISVQQSVFDEYARGLRATTLLHLLSVDPLPGTIVFEYDLGTAFVMLDRLLGGVGKAPTQEREVTDIESMLLQTISGIFVDGLSAAWQHIVPMEAKLLRLEYSPRYLQIAPLNEPVALVLFDLRVGERQTTMSMCIPYSVLEPISADLNLQSLFVTAMKESDPAHVSAPPRLRQVTIPVVATLGSTSLSLGEVNDLQEDDVIRLDGLASEPIVVTINKRPTFVARPGLAHRGLAVQILGVLPDEDAER
jgi:flagellar motor switch protein FliM